MLQYYYYLNINNSNNIFRMNWALEILFTNARNEQCKIQMSVLYLNCTFGAWNVARAPFLMEKTEGKISPKRSSLRRRIILKRLLKKWDGKA